MCTIAEFDNILKFNDDELEAHVPDNGDIYPKLNISVSFCPNVDYSNDEYFFTKLALNIERGKYYHNPQGGLICTGPS